VRVPVRVAVPPLALVKKRFVVEPVVVKKFVVVAEVPVAFVKRMFVKVALVPARFVAKRFVEVALVVVLFAPVKFWRVVEPVRRRFDADKRPVSESAPPFAPVKKRFVLDAVVAKRLVVVAFVVVELSPVKFWRVEEPVTRRFESVERPPVAVRVVPTLREPVRLAALEIVWPLMRPEVMVPEPIEKFPVPEMSPVKALVVPSVRRVVPEASFMALPFSWSLSSIVRVSLVMS